MSERQCIGIHISGRLAYEIGGLPSMGPFGLRYFRQVPEYVVV